MIPVRGILAVLFAMFISVGGLSVAEELTDIQVDPQLGDDANDGRAAPVKTIARGIKLAQPGDTISLKPAVYYESAIFHGKHGEVDKPIVLDGHGATLDGSEPVTEAEWDLVGPDLYCRKKLYPNTDDAIVGRWFLLWDGKMQRMNRCLKGSNVPLKKPEELEPGEWTFVREDGDAFYLKLNPGQKLDEAKIRYPARSNAVAFGGSGSWVTVRNVTGTHVYNDGYNIHGAQRNLVFENIAAIECGDDGFSAHEDGDCHIDGFVSIGNGTGICDTGTCRTYYRNVWIKDCVGVDLYFIGLEHSLENAVIESRAAKSFLLDGGRLSEGQICQLMMKNVSITRHGEPAGELRVGRGGYLYAENCSFDGLSVMLTPMGSINFQRCLFRKGDFEPGILLFANTMWQGAGNIYDLESLRVDQTSYTPDTFSNFQNYTRSEKGSQWGAADNPGEGIGADHASLTKLESLLFGEESQSDSVRTGEGG